MVEPIYPKKSLHSVKLQDSGHVDSLDLNCSQFVWPEEEKKQEPKVMSVNQYERQSSQNLQNEVSAFAKRWYNNFIYSYSTGQRQAKRSTIKKALRYKTVPFNDK